MSDNSDMLSLEDKVPGRGEKRDKGLYSPSKRRKTTSRPKKRVDKPPSVSPVIASNVFLYKPDAELPDLTNYLNQTIEVKIERRYITKDNPNVAKRKFWGSETYTSNSDMVCILLHFGKFSIEELNNNKFRDGVNLFLSVSKSKRTYNSSDKDGFVSRKYNHINQFPGHSLKPTEFKYTQNSFNFTDQGNCLVSYAEKMVVKKKQRKNTEPVSPVGFPVPCSNIIYNMNNDPAYAFSLMNICDKGKDPKNWLCIVLKKQVLYIDTEDDRRIEISRFTPQHHKFFGDDTNFKVAEVLDPWKLPAETMANENVPLSEQQVKVVFPEVKWADICWADSSLRIREFNLTGLLSYKLYPNKIIIHTDVINID